MVTDDRAANRCELASYLVLATRDQPYLEQRQSLVHGQGPVLEDRLRGMAIILFGDASDIFFWVPAQIVLECPSDWAGGAFDDGPVYFGWCVLAKLLTKSGGGFAGPRKGDCSSDWSIEPAYNSKTSG